MACLTIFTSPKPFVDPHAIVIQSNAIRSWKELGVDVDVILMGRDEGVAEAAAEFGVRHMPDVRCSEKGIPFIGSMFDLARQESDAPVLAIVNADIILLPDFLEAAKRMKELGKPFVVVGQRWDLDVTAMRDFRPGWQAGLKEEAHQYGQLHPPAGSDYFMYSRDAFTQVPDFTIGRAGWDNWMLYEAASQPWLLIDATEDIMIVHQNHDYRHLPGGAIHYKLPASKKNVDLAGGESKMLNLLDLRHRLVGGKVKRAPLTWLRVVRWVERLVTPKGEIKGLRGRVFRTVRRYRKRL